MKKKFFVVVNIALLTLFAVGCSNSARAYMRDGLESYKRKQYEGSYKLYQTALKEDPQLAEAYYHLGNLWRDWKGEEKFEGATGYDHAIEAYSKAITLKEDYVLAYNNRAHIYKTQKKYDEAIKGYEEVLKFNPNSARSYDSLSLIYKEYYDKSQDINHLVQAKRNIDKAIENDLENPDFYSRRAEMYMLEKSYEKAIEDYSKVMELSSRSGRLDFRAQMERGKAYFESKQYKKCVQDFTACENNGLQHPDISKYKKLALRKLSSE